MIVEPSCRWANDGRSWGSSLFAAFLAFKDLAVVVVVVVVVVMREFGFLAHATQHSPERWRGLAAQKEVGFFLRLFRCVTTSS